jgi:hypothetical protein
MIIICDSKTIIFECAYSPVCYKPLGDPLSLSIEHAYDNRSKGKLSQAQVQSAPGTYVSKMAEPYQRRTV